MDSSFSLDGALAGLQGIVAQVMAYLPRVAAALLVLVAGWLLSRQLRVLVVRLIGSLDHVWQRFVTARGHQQIQPRHPPTRIVGELIFWFLMLIFVTLATEILGLGIFGTWLKEIVTYLPLVVAGLLIVLVGFVVSSLARDLLASAADSAGISHGDLLGRIVQIVILFVAIIIGVDQIGIDVEFITVVAGIVLAATLGGVALAFGLGASTHVGNIIAANQLRKIYRIGDRVRLGDIEGRVLEITVSRVMLETEAGTADIPAMHFDQQVSVILEKGG